MKSKELIGKEILGFKFPSGVYEYYAGYDKLRYNPDMDKCVGVVGKITSANITSGNFSLVTIAFPNGDSWNYPKELVIEKLGTRSVEPEIFKLL